jgi:hypothetical protein
MVGGGLAMFNYSNVELDMRSWKYRENRSYPEWVVTEKYYNCEGFSDKFYKRSVISRLFKKNN